MPERASINQVTQFGLEVTSGTSVAANKKFDSITVAVTPKETTRAFMGQGFKHDNYVQYVMGEVEAAVAGWPGYAGADLYLLSSHLGAATISSIGQASNQWAFNPNATDVDTPKTFTVQQGSSVRAHQFSYGTVTDYGWTWDRSGKVELSGVKMIGQQLSDGITLTSSPTLVTNVPWAAVDYQVYLDTTSGGLGGTRLTRVVQASMASTGKYKQWYPSDRSQSSWSFLVDTAYKIEHKLLVEADAAGMGILTHLRAGDHLFLRHEFKGAIMPGENAFSVSLGGPSAGNFTLTYGGQTTSNIAYNATSATVQTALTGLSGVGSGNATVSGSAGGPYTVIFTSALAGSTNVLTGSGAGLTGGTFAITNNQKFYSFTHDHAVEVASVSDFKDDAGIYAIEATLSTIYDSTWGKSQVLTIQNQVASL